MQPVPFFYRPGFNCRSRRSDIRLASDASGSEIQIEEVTPGTFHQLCDTNDVASMVMEWAFAESHAILGWHRTHPRSPCNSNATQGRAPDLRIETRPVLGRDHKGSKAMAKGMVFIGHSLSGCLPKLLQRQFRTLRYGYLCEGWSNSS